MIKKKITFQWILQFQQTREKKKMSKKLKNIWERTETKDDNCTHQYQQTPNNPEDPHTKKKC